MDWFYAIENERFGPVSGDRLQAMYSAGELSDDTLVWNDNMADWQALRSVAHELHGSIAQETAPLAESGSMGTSTGSCSVCGKTFPTRDLKAQNGVPICTNCQESASPIPSSQLDRPAARDWGPCEIGNIFSQSLTLFKANTIPMALCFFVMLMLAIIASAAAEFAGYDLLLALLAQVLVGWVGTSIGMGLVKFYLDIADYGEGSMGSLFAYWRPAVTVLIAGYLMGIVTAIGCFLLLLPGIYIFLRLFLFSTFSVDKKINGFEGLSQCWESTGSHILQLLMVVIVQAGLLIAGVMLLGVGIFATGPLAVCMSIVTYRTLQPRGAN